MFKRRHPISPEGSLHQPRSSGTSRRRQIEKRLFDLAVAGAAFVVLLPVLGVVAVLVRIFLGSPVIFRQERPGFQGEPFMIYKFRSMLDLSDVDGNPLDDEERLTRFGRLLRSSSLDELPELWNVLRGEMSVVGPRPLMMSYLPRYDAEQARRHDVKPGVTGLAQVGGRNALTWDEKFAFDIEYVDSHSVWLDLEILARTVQSVGSRSGISHGDHSTMPDFMGNEVPGTST